MSPLVKTKRQANFKDFKRFGAFKELVQQKKTLYSTRSCVNWAFFGPLVPKNPNLHKNSSNNKIIVELFLSLKIKKKVKTPYFHFEKQKIFVKKNV
jgi:hypothetical protein